MDKLAKDLNAKALEFEGVLAHWAEEKNLPQQKFRVTIRPLITRGRPKPTFQKITEEEWRKIFSLPWNLNRQADEDALEVLNEFSKDNSGKSVSDYARSTINRKFDDHNLPFRLFAITRKLAKDEGVEFPRYNNSYKLYKVRIEK